MSKSKKPLNNTEKIALAVFIFSVIKWIADWIIKIIFKT